MSDAPPESRKLVEVPMRALTVRPGTKDSLAIDDLPEPPESDGPVLVESLAVGLCGTDVEIIAADYGEAPPGADVLVLGHENLGKVASAPTGSDLTPGDLVVGIVRRPDPQPCPACARGEWDMCRNGQYTEHGIKGLHGFARERWRAQPDAVVKVDPKLGDVGVLLEPTTIVAKGWEQIERIGSRAFFDPKVVAVTGLVPSVCLPRCWAFNADLRCMSSTGSPLASSPTSWRTSAPRTTRRRYPVAAYDRTS